ncbi:DegV family protein [Paratractidigestivibacter sp.]|uniref:DegV family protein n=1 Tax=Paratractidigestivibacter sp. TaxID=2847316 RepID=UPI003AB22006
MSEIVIIAESGSDVPAAEAAELGIEIVPMHVSIGQKTIDDGELPPAEMLEECRQLGVLPRTSGCTPGDFSVVLDRVHAEHPNAQILYIAYSAVTTCSYESARTAAEGRDYVHMFDTRHVTIGQGFVVTQTARHLAENPDISVEELMAWSEELASRVRMGFVPGDLGYLRAGGRLSNAAFVGATLLRIKPIIELIEGKLVATKKLRGNMEKAAIGLMDHMALQGDYDTDVVYLLHSAGLPDSIQRAAEEHARELGFKSIRWYESHNVITSHCGPGSFALAFAGAK